MASKSKRRGRVFRASCILAALIIAGSSFAWFTSQDEVTNRLTANSDYGVSIVESFVPPKNMIPGQEINKDVYAVNTGNIAAFVKETVSGVLNYTYESKVDTFDAAQCVELTKTAATAIDGATTEEAGGFLAWSSVPSVPLGSVNSARTEDGIDDTWHPTVEGDYIFRRSINTKDDGATVESPKFTYAGYHFVPGTPAVYETGYNAENDPEGEHITTAAVPDKYYKIVIGNDSFRAAEEGLETDGTAKFVFDISTNNLGTGVTVDAEGKVTNGTPAIQYVIEKTVENAVPVLTYGETDDVNRDGNSDKYLTAYYADGQAQAANLAQKAADLSNAQVALAAAETALNNASATATQDEVAYQDALGAYNTALSRYMQTKLDYEYAKALTQATNDLIAAANERGQKENAKDTDAAELKAAAEKLQGDADTLLTNNAWLAAMDTDYDTPTAATAVDASPYGSKSLITPATRARITAYNTAYGGLDSVIANMGLMDAKYDQIKEYASKIYEALKVLQAIETGDPNTVFNSYTSDVDVNAQQKIIDDNYALLVTALNEYNNLYTGIVQNAVGTIGETNLTDLTFDNLDTLSDFIDGSDTTNKFTNLDITDLDTDADDYEQKYRDYKTQVDTTIPNANTAWETAVNNYNKAVTTAKNTYDTGISAARPNPNMYGAQDTTGTASYLDDANAQVNLNLTNNGTTLVPFNDATNTAGYSANFNTSNADPTIGTYDAAADTTTGAPAWTIYTQETKPDSTTYSTRTIGASIVPVNNMTVATEAAFAPLATGDGSALGTRADDTTPATVGSLAEALDTAAATLKTKKDTYLGEDGTGTTSGTKAAYTAAQTAYTNAGTAVGDAQTALDNAATTGSTIKIYIVLDDDVNTNWTKEAVTNEDGDAIAYNFYLNKVLEASETSEKLIDYVMLANTTKSTDYKDLTFDLNVELKSAQVTYDANQQNYTAEAVDANTTDFDLTVGNITNNTDVTWTARS